MSPQVLENLGMQAAADGLCKTNVASLVTVRCCVALLCGNNL